MGTKTGASLSGDVIRKTLCATPCHWAVIAGAVAEARFGVPDAIAGEALRRLPEDMRAIVGQHRHALGETR